MNNWSQLPSKEIVTKTIEALQNNSITSEYVENKEQAKKRVLELVPKSAEVMTMTSVTLDTVGITQEINESGNYDAVKPKLANMNRETQHLEMQKLGAAPEYALGSLHSVTQDGKLLFASNTGSQLSAYSYASAHVILLVGTQKIVKNVDEAMKRVYEYVLPLESERARKAYGSEGSNVSKLLIINKEVVPGRIHIIFINQNLGF